MRESQCQYRIIHVPHKMHYLPLKILCTRAHGGSTFYLNRSRQGYARPSTAVCYYIKHPKTYNLTAILVAGFSTHHCLPSSCGPSEVEEAAVDSCLCCSWQVLQWRQHQLSPESPHGKFWTNGWAQVPLQAPHMTHWAQDPQCCSSPHLEGIGMHAT